MPSVGRIKSSEIPMARIDQAVILLFFIATLVSALFLPVNPWPRDGWFQTQYWLIGTFPGADNYSPIAAPAIQYKISHLLADIFGAGLRGEMYIASLIQNLLIFFSFIFIYCSGKLLTSVSIAASVTMAFLVFALSTGLAQAFWSETIVLFLFSWVLYLTLKLRLVRRYTTRQFYSRAALSGLLIGILVATRIVPVFLIPGLAFLFMPDWKTKKFLGHMAIVVVMTAFVVAAMLASNYARFGRVEISASSGRHLWQGVNQFVDSALADSEEYRQLESFNNGLQGKNHWEIKVPENLGGALSGGDVLDKVATDAVLGRLAKQAILKKPLPYLRQGLQNFAETIGQRPYRLGFGQKGGHYDPLGTDEPLLPLAQDRLNVPPNVVGLVGRLSRIAFRISESVYPVTLFFVLSSMAAILISGAGYARGDMNRRKTSGDSYTLNRTAIYGLTGIAAIGLLVWRIPSTGSLLFATVVCAAILCVQLVVFLRWQEDDNRMHPIHGWNHFLIFAFLAMIFFGSLWFSWQIEVKNSRNALPYQPFLILMVCLATTYWSSGVKRLTSILRNSCAADQN